MERGTYFGVAAKSGVGGGFFANALRFVGVHDYRLEYSRRDALDVGLLCSARDFFALAKLAYCFVRITSGFACFGTGRGRNRLLVLRVMFILRWSSLA